VKRFQNIALGNEKYPALTGVRAASASFVFFEHFPLWPDAHIVISALAMFYVLSGFLIVRIYFRQVEMSGRWLSRYFLNRFARIYPVYFLLLTLVVCFGHPHDAGVLLKNYTLTHALFAHTPLLIQPSWSLTVEECFYFLAPAFMLLTRRWGFAMAFLGGSLLLAAALGLSTLPTDFLHTPLFVLSTTFFGHFVEFFAGVFLALVVMKLEERKALPTPGAWATLAGGAGVALLTGAMALVYRHTPLNHGAIVLINNFLIPAPIALLYAGLIRENTFLARVLSGKVAGLLGRSSYSFYLLHTIVIYHVIAPLAQVTGHPALWSLATFIVTWLASVALFVLFEEPVNLWIRRRFQSKDESLGMTQTLFPAGSR
jgi:peptidoglycan/LPS O-acetylase OafA/YrhL